MVNAALFLRRPLLVTGRPGTGKSTLAYSIARELKLGPVLRWPITSRSTLLEGLYRYDAIGQLREEHLWQLRARTSAEVVPAAEPHSSAEAASFAGGIGRHLRLGPLGTSLLPYSRPRVLLIDEMTRATSTCRTTSSTCSKSASTTSMNWPGYPKRQVQCR